MSEHYFMLADLTDGPHETAEVEVSTNGDGNVTIDVFTSEGGAVSAVFPVLAPSFFASSVGSTLPNLFTASGGRAALVRVHTTLGLASKVVLRQRSGTSEIVLDVPTVGDGGGTAFLLPVGAVGPDTAVLVGNLQPSPVSLRVTIGSDAFTVHVVPANGLIRIPLTTPNARAFLEITTAGSLAIVAYELDLHPRAGLTFVLPSSS